MKQVVILGATGSIGDNALAVLEQHPNEFQVLGFSAHRDSNKALDLTLRLSPRWVAMADPRALDALVQGYRQAAPAGHSEPIWLGGEESLEELAQLPEADLVVAGVVGIAGLRSTLAAARAGKTILLANKEAVVCGGHLLKEAIGGSGGQILPIDSEHNAIFQCLPPSYRCFQRPEGVARIVLTASGGPFRTWSAGDIQHASREQALKHPNWSMGAKITIDSASMMNKALEVIEAHWLFGLPSEDIDVLVHPQSVVHSMVEMCDGSVLAQMGSPDMRLPIAHAFHRPERRASAAQRLRWDAGARLDFEPPDPEKFPALRLGRQAMQAGVVACTVLNAANEVAVQAFLDGRIGFGRLTSVVEECLSRDFTASPFDTLDAMIDVDQTARRRATELL